MRWSTRVPLASLGVVLIPLVVLALVGVLSISRRFSQSGEGAVQEWVRAIAAQVSITLEDLQREARLLARDPAIIQGVVRSDWATLARGASPRMLSLTLERVADLVLIVDERGAPLVQVPAGAGLSVGSPAPVGAVHLVSGVPMLVGAASVVHDGRTLGTVAVGRTFERLARGVAAPAGRMELLFLSGDEPAYTTLASRAGGVRWAEATRTGKVELLGTSYLVRPIARWPSGTLWLLASDAEVRATRGGLWVWAVAFVLLAALATITMTWRLTRRAPRPVESQDATGLEGAAREKGERLESLIRLAQTVTASLDLDEVLDGVVQAASKLIPGSSVRLWVAEEDRLVLRRENGAEGTPLGGGRTTLALGEGLAGHVVQSREPLVVERVLEDPRTVNVEWMRQEGYVSFGGIPLLFKNWMLGVLVVLTRRQHRFTKEEVELLLSFAIQAAIAIDHARLFAENRRKIEELSVLCEVSRAVTGQLDLSELVRAIHVQVGRVLDARNMVILLHDKAQQEVEVALRVSQGEPQAVPKRYPFGEGLISRIIERGQSIRTDNYAEECRREGVRPVQDSLRYPHWLGVPMIAGDETIGGLLLRSDVHAFSAADERLLMNIAGLAALAFRTARTFDERTRAYAELAGAQDQLIRTEKIRALGEMAYGVAHDFNNLLASILGRTQLLLRKVDDPKLRQWLEVIERAATDGARSVRRIQELARIRRDQPFVAVDLNRVAREALEGTRPRWLEETQSRGVTIEVVTELGAIPPIAGDPVELRDVLTNLILNAVDAMPDGGTLTLSTRADETAVTVIVSDTGVGMSADVQRRIFHGFFTTKGPRGTGLGLSTSYSIVSRHGGQIAVESAEGRGSTFRLTFPVRRAAPEPESEPPEAFPAAPVPLRCLVVDDEQPVLDMLGDMLAVGGHFAVPVADGAVAIERFKAEPFDLVLTDLGMPRVNGWQVAQAVKGHAPSVPVLLITGWGVELSAEELRAHGVDAVLTKPIRLEDMLAAVARYGARPPH